MSALQNISSSERERIAHNLHHNIHGFLDEVKGHVAKIEEEVKQLEAIDLGAQIDALIDEAYQKILQLKLGQ